MTEQTITSRDYITTNRWTGQPVYVVTFRQGASFGFGTEFGGRLHVKGYTAERFVRMEADRLGRGILFDATR